MSDKLRKLMEMARRVSISPAEREAQRISFAYGNTALENSDITRDDVVRASAAMRASHDDATGQSCDEPSGE